jgi:hypothetical protein
VCAIRAEVIGEPGIHENSVTAWGFDWYKDPVSYTTNAEVAIVGLPPESGIGMPTAVVVGGTAALGLGLLLAGVILRRRTA